MQRNIGDVFTKEFENHVAFSLAHTNHMVDEPLGEPDGHSSTQLR